MGSDAYWATTDLGSLTARLRVLLRLLATPKGGFNSQIWSYLSAGCAMFGASKGFFYQRSYGRFGSFEISAGEPVENLVVSEEIFDYAKQALLSMNEPQALLLTSESGQINENLPSLAYTHAGPGVYLVAPLVNASSALVFVVGAPENGAHYQLSEEDRETLVLLAEGVAHMVHLHASPDKILRGQQGFSVSGIRSLSEFIELAQLPAVFGVSGRVLDVLQRRVGQSSLSIDAIASELSLSKRTLQRRLQQSDINFAMLRDQVRFHHAIGFLVDQNMSIDKISTALDFSDRTSFTNAFKRWTGLSPSTFRKLFRDYA